MILGTQNIKISNDSKGLEPTEKIGIYESIDE